MLQENNQRRYEDVGRDSLDKTPNVCYWLSTTFCMILVYMYM